MRSPVVLFITLLLAAAPAHANDEPLVGKYRLGGREGARALTGTIVVRRDGAGLTFSGPLGSRGDVTFAGTAEGGTYRFEPTTDGSGSGGVGLVGALTPGDAPAPETGPAQGCTLTLRPGATAGKFTGQLAAADGRRLMTVELTRKRQALIAYATGYQQDHDDVFRVYGKKIATYYKALGLEVNLLPVASWDEVLEALRAAGQSGAVYSRLVTIGHGGWDGPMMHGQLSPWLNATRWTELVEAVRVGTTPDAKYLVSACHAGGSDRFEKARGDARDDRSWVDQVARATGRTVTGPAGTTSTTFAFRQAQAAEGAGAFAQETRVASAAGVKVCRGWLAPAKLVPWAQVDAEKAARDAASAAATTTTAP